MLQTAVERLSGKQRKFLIIGSISLFVILIAIPLFASATQQESSRTASYKEVPGAAGLAATISYDCQQDCEQQYNFNVYIFDESGRQVSTIQPSAEGKVNMALPEGHYSMLIGKRFGDDSIFPQEFVELKNGQVLELKLRYS